MNTVARCCCAALPLAALARLGVTIAAALREALCATPMVF